MFVVIERSYTTVILIRSAISAVETIRRVLLVFFISFIRLTKRVLYNLQNFFIQVVIFIEIITYATESENYTELQLSKLLFE